jgi:aerobic C4-dicarboxylate transport protein
MSKMHRAGCSEPVVGFVVPLGYSFNLTGTSIYLTLATVFIAEATNTRIAIGKALALFTIMLVTSKTAAAVTGGGFVTLAATLMAAGDVPVAGLTLLVGIDRIMSEARAFTNLTGNAVAAAVVSRWEGELDVQRAERVLSDVAAVEREEYEAGRADPAASVPDVA